MSSEVSVKPIDPRLTGHTNLLTAVWLIQLRWIAVVGQCLAVGITVLSLGISIPLIPVLSCIAVTATSNIAFGYLVRYFQRRHFEQNSQLVAGAGSRHVLVESRLNHSWLGGLILLDVLTLTGLLYYTGGVANPFACFFLANIVVGGLILSPPWTWFLTALTILCTVALLVAAPPLPAIGIEFPAGSSFWSVPKQGLLIGLGTCSCVIAYFITVLVRELRQSESRLVEAEEQRESAQRIEALATLAAGAGHELASPLSTIAVVAKEMSRRLEKSQSEAWIRRDVDLIRSELDRCREILQRMKSGAGEAAAEVMHAVNPSELISMILSPLRQPERVEVVLEPTIKNDSAKLPLQAVSQAMRNLVQNALDASEPTAKVALHLEGRGDDWLITIIDRGTGMNEETLRRVGQPFFTTKDVGQGMGLGVFLTRNVLAGLGSKIEFESQLGRGTTCRVTIPKSRSPVYRAIK